MVNVLGATVQRERDGEVELRPSHVRGRREHTRDCTQSHHFLHFIPDED